MTMAARRIIARLHGLNIQADRLTSDVGTDIGNLTANRAIIFVVKGNDVVDVQHSDRHWGLVVKMTLMSINIADLAPLGGQLISRWRSPPMGGSGPPSYRNEFGPAPPSSTLAMPARTSQGVAPAAGFCARSSGNHRNSATYFAPQQPGKFDGNEKIDPFARFRNQPRGGHRHDAFVVAGLYLTGLSRPKNQVITALDGLAIRDADRSLEFSARHRAQRRGRADLAEMDIEMRQHGRVRL
jgi:hypothetical protein